MAQSVQNLCVSRKVFLKHLVDWRSFTARRRNRVPMSNQSTTSNTHRHILRRDAPLGRCSGLLLILNSMHNAATDRSWARLRSKTPPAKKTLLLIILSSSLRCESAAEHHTAEQYSKTGKAMVQNDLRRSDRSWNTYQRFLMIPSLWATVLETAKVLPKGHLNIKRHPQYNLVSRLLPYSSIQSQWSWLGNELCVTWRLS